MRLSSPPESVEQLLRALYEGTASDVPWVDHNGAAWEMGELAYDEEADEYVPYRALLLTRASDRTRALTRQAACAVHDTADRLLALLDSCERTTKEREP